MSRETFNCSWAGFDSVGDWAEHFYKLARKSNRLFLSIDGFLLHVDPTRGPVRLVSLNDFYRTISDVVDPIRYTSDNVACPALPGRDGMMALFDHPAKVVLPRVDAVVHEPVVVRASSGYQLVESPGYNPSCNIYYWRHPERGRLPVRDSTTALTRCFSGVPFQSAGDNNNVYAWLLSAVVLDKTIMPPMLTITGNDRGVGKSSLVQACGIILTNKLQSPIHPTGAEFDKQLSARFLESERFISLDNITVPTTTGGFRNQRLAKLLTDGWSKRVRVLGQSRSVEQQGVLFAVTMNDCRLDPDLSTRSLAVQLYRERQGPMRPYCVEEAFEHRDEIYGELLGLALRDPKPTEFTADPTFRFRSWLRFVVPRIVPAFGPLNLEASAELDDEVQDLFAWGDDLGPGAHFDPPQLYDAVMSNPTRLPALNSFVGGGKGEMGRLRKVEYLLAKYTDRAFSPHPGHTIRLACLDDGEAKRYTFLEV